VRLRQPRIDVERSLRFGTDARQRLEPRNTASGQMEEVRAQTTVREGEVLIELDGLFEESAAPRQRFRRCAPGVSDSAICSAPAMDRAMSSWIAKISVRSRS
jgi:hypothetical protein